MHQVKGTLAEACVPTFQSDGLRTYFYALTAHFGSWVLPVGARVMKWQVDARLLYGQLVKRTTRRKLGYAITRMMWGKYKELRAKLTEVGLSGLIQTAFVERLNLTVRQGVAPLGRKTWALMQTEANLRLHVEWWRLYYHFARPHGSLRGQTPALAAGLTDRVWTVGELIRTPLIVAQA